MRNANVHSCNSQDAFDRFFKSLALINLHLINSLLMEQSKLLFVNLSIYTQHIAGTFLMVWDTLFTYSCNLMYRSLRSKARDDTHAIILPPQSTVKHKENYINRTCTCMPSSSSTPSYHRTVRKKAIKRPFHSRMYGGEQVCRQKRNVSSEKTFRKTTSSPGRKTWETETHSNEPLLGCGAPHCSHVWRYWLCPILIT